MTGTHDDGHYEEVQAVGKSSICCYRCGGQGHVARDCATPEPKGKGKGKGKDGKGKGKSKGKNDWNGYCSYCGKQGHGPRDCWKKQREEATAAGDQGRGVGLASVDDEDNTYDNDGDINGFDVANLDIDLESKAPADAKQKLPTWRSSWWTRGQAKRSRRAG